MDEITEVQVWSIAESLMETGADENRRREMASVVRHIIYLAAEEVEARRKAAEDY